MHGNELGTIHFSGGTLDNKFHGVLEMLVDYRKRKRGRFPFLHSLLESKNFR